MACWQRVSWKLFAVRQSLEQLGEVQIGLGGEGQRTGLRTLHPSDHEGCVKRLTEMTLRRGGSPDKEGCSLPETDGFSVEHLDGWREEDQRA